MTLQQPPWTITTTDTTCAQCRKPIKAGSAVLPTRGAMRHNGKWIGTCCRERR